MRKTIKNAVFILLFLTLSASTAFLTYLHFIASDDKDLSGEWTANIDMTEQAAVTAFSWLKDIEGVSVSYEEIESYMQELTMKVNLDFEKTERSAGTFQSNISPESYEACNQAAYAAFATVFQELLTERIRMTDYAGSTDKEAIEALVTETFGMSTVSYLMSYGPTLLPSLEDLQAEYDGSGTYEITDDILTRQFEVGGSVPTKAEYYIRKDSNLVLSGEIDSVSDGPLSDYYPIIYTLRQTSDQ